MLFNVLPERKEFPTPEQYEVEFRQKNADRLAMLAERGRTVVLRFVEDAEYQQAKACLYMFADEETMPGLLFCCEHGIGGGVMLDVYVNGSKAPSTKEEANGEVGKAHRRDIEQMGGGFELVRNAGDAYQFRRDIQTAGKRINKAARKAEEKAAKKLRKLGFRPKAKN
jgi:hypothetical protein